MNSIAYPENSTKKPISGRLAKAVILLVLSLGLLWFSNSFSFYRFLEPQSTGWVLWVSYARDLIAPFAFYFFLCIGERWLKTWKTRAFITLLIPIAMEIGQAFYYQFSPTRYVGSFDLLDIVMYAISVTVAVIVEQKVFKKLFKFW